MVHITPFLHTTTFEFFVDSAIKFSIRYAKLRYSSWIKEIFNFFKLFTSNILFRYFNLPPVAIMKITYNRNIPISTKQAMSALLYDIKPTMFHLKRTQFNNLLKNIQSYVETDPYSRIKAFNKKVSLRAYCWEHEYSDATLYALWAQDYSYGLCLSNGMQNRMPHNTTRARKNRRFSRNSSKIKVSKYDEDALHTLSTLRSITYEDVHPESLDILDQNSFFQTIEQNLKMIDPFKKNTSFDSLKRCGFSDSIEIDTNKTMVREKCLYSPMHYRRSYLSDWDAQFFYHDWDFAITTALYLTRHRYSNSGILYKFSDLFSILPPPPNPSKKPNLDSLFVQDHEITAARSTPTTTTNVQEAYQETYPETCQKTPIIPRFTSQAKEYLLLQVQQLFHDPGRCVSYKDPFFLGCLKIINSLEMGYDIEESWRSYVRCLILQFSKFQHPLEYTILSTIVSGNTSIVEYEIPIYKVSINNMSKGVGQDGDQFGYQLGDQLGDHHGDQLGDHIDSQLLWNIQEVYTRKYQYMNIDSTESIYCHEIIDQKNDSLTALLSSDIKTLPSIHTSSSSSISNQEDIIILEDLISDSDDILNEFNPTLALNDTTCHCSHIESIEPYTYHGPNFQQHCACNTVSITSPKAPTSPTSLVSLPGISLVLPQGPFLLVRPWYLTAYQFISRSWRLEHTIDEFNIPIGGLTYFDWVKSTQHRRETNNDGIQPLMWLNYTTFSISGNSGFGKTYFLYYLMHRIVMLHKIQKKEKGLRIYCQGFGSQKSTFEFYIPGDDSRLVHIEPIIEGNVDNLNVITSDANSTHATTTTTTTTDESNKIFDSLETIKSNIHQQLETMTDNKIPNNPSLQHAACLPPFDYVFLNTTKFNDESYINSFSPDSIRSEQNNIVNPIQSDEWSYYRMRMLLNATRWIIVDRGKQTDSFNTSAIKNITKNINRILESEEVVEKTDKQEDKHSTVTITLDDIDNLNNTNMTTNGGIEKTEQPKNAAFQFTTLPHTNSLYSQDPKFRQHTLQIPAFTYDELVAASYIPRIELVKENQYRSQCSNQRSIILSHECPHHGHSSVSASASASANIGHDQEKPTQGCTILKYIHPAVIAMRYHVVGGDILQVLSDDGPLWVTIPGNHTSSHTSCHTSRRRLAFEYFQSSSSSSNQLPIHSLSALNKQIPSSDVYSATLPGYLGLDTIRFGDVECTLTPFSARFDRFQYRPELAANDQVLEGNNLDKQKKQLLQEISKLPLKKQEEISPFFHFRLHNQHILSSYIHSNISTIASEPIYFTTPESISVKDISLASKYAYEATARHIFAIFTLGHDYYRFHSHKSHSPTHSYSRNSTHNSRESGESETSGESEESKSESESESKESKESKASKKSRESRSNTTNFKDIHETYYNHLFSSFFQVFSSNTLSIKNNLHQTITILSQFSNLDTITNLENDMAGVIAKNLIYAFHNTFILSSVGIDEIITPWQEGDIPIAIHDNVANSRDSSDLKHFEHSSSSAIFSATSSATSSVIPSAISYIPVESITLEKYHQLINNNTNERNRILHKNYMNKNAVNNTRQGVSHEQQHQDQIQHKNDTSSNLTSRIYECPIQTIPYPSYDEYINRKIKLFNENKKSNIAQFEPQIVSQHDILFVSLSSASRYNIVESDNTVFNSLLTPTPRHDSLLIYLIIAFRNNITMMRYIQDIFFEDYFRILAIATAIIPELIFPTATTMDTTDAADTADTADTAHMTVNMTANTADTVANTIDMKDMAGMKDMTINTTHNLNSPEENIELKSLEPLMQPNPLEKYTKLRAMDRITKDYHKFIIPGIHTIEDIIPSPDFNTTFFQVLHWRHQKPSTVSYHQRYDVFSCIRNPLLQNVFNSYPFSQNAFMSLMRSKGEDIQKKDQKYYSSKQKLIPLYSLGKDITSAHPLSLKLHQSILQKVQPYIPQSKREYDITNVEDNITISNIASSDTIDTIDTVSKRDSSMSSMISYFDKNTIRIATIATDDTTTVETITESVKISTSTTSITSTSASASTPTPIDSTSTPILKKVLPLTIKHKNQVHVSLQQETLCSEFTRWCYPFHNIYANGRFGSDNFTIKYFPCDSTQHLCVPKVEYFQSSSRILVNEDSDYLENKNMDRKNINIENNADFSNDMMNEFSVDAMKAYKHIPSIHCTCQLCDIDPDTFSKHTSHSDDLGGISSSTIYDDNEDDEDNEDNEVNEDDDKEDDEDNEDDGILNPAATSDSDLDIHNTSESQKKDRIEYVNERGENGDNSDNDDDGDDGDDGDDDGDHDDICNLQILFKNKIKSKNKRLSPSSHNASDGTDESD